MGGVLLFTMCGYFTLAASQRDNSAHILQNLCPTRQSLYSFHNARVIIPNLFDIYQIKG